MPELPEVETICRGLRPHIIGRTVDSIHCSGLKLRVSIPYTEMCHCLIGNKITDVRRRAKYLLIEMVSGHILIIHLGMTGKLGIYSPSLPPARHCHVRFLLSDGLELRYIDSRRFGSMHVVQPEQAAKMESTFFATTGPEPFSRTCSAQYLQRCAEGRAVPVKTFIMTGRIMAGVGNIYANESLFQAGIAPGRAAANIALKEWRRLIVCIRKVLSHAIECGGSTISDYVNADQQSGYFQINFQVYGRGAKPCRTCGTAVEKVQIGGRASYYCPQCQK
jgi:formamidopyrimidine-DNA glycosylase